MPSKRTSRKKRMGVPTIHLDDSDDESFNVDLGPSSRRYSNTGRYRTNATALNKIARGFMARKRYRMMRTRPSYKHYLPVLNLPIRTPQALDYERRQRRSVAPGAAHRNRWNDMLHRKILNDRGMW